MKHLKKYWKTYLTILNTFMCVLVISWCLIVPSVNKWQDVYLIDHLTTTYSLKDGYKSIKIKKDGKMIRIKLVTGAGKTLQRSVYRDDVYYIDYL